MLSTLFSALADSFRARLFDDPAASATASHFDALATSERTQEAFDHSSMFDHSGSGFDHSSMFDHGSSFGSNSFGSDSFGGGSSSFD